MPPNIRRKIDFFSFSLIYFLIKTQPSHISVWNITVAHKERCTVTKVIKRVMLDLYYHYNNYYFVLLLLLLLFLLLLRSMVGIPYKLPLCPILVWMYGATAWRCKRTGHVRKESGWGWLGGEMVDFENCPLTFANTPRLKWGRRGKVHCVVQEFQYSFTVYYHISSCPYLFFFSLCFLWCGVLISVSASFPEASWLSVLLGGGWEWGWCCSGV